MKILFILLFSLYSYAASYKVSSIVLPRTYVQNLDPFECDDRCLDELVTHGQIFSFLAHAQGKIDDDKLNEKRMIYVSLFNLGSSFHGSRLRIALLLPYKVIGRYASSTTNAVFSYMLAKNRDFTIKSFQIEDESIASIHAALIEIQQEHFYYVIAPLTHNGVQAVVDIDPDLNVYFPTINKNEITSTSTSLFFGGIDYKAQTEILTREATSPMVIYYDKSKLGKRLRNYAKDAYYATDDVKTPYVNAKNPTKKAYSDKRVLSYAVGKRTTNLEHHMKENSRIQNASFFLNTPIIKSGMVMSQLTLYDINVTNILSTQINYDPLILSITQAKDRNNMIIANSIEKNNNVLIEANMLLNNDIVYDWINYSTTVGSDYFFHLITHDKREYELAMQDNQIIYPISLVQPSYSRFVPFIRYDDLEE